jgi:gamma-glutamyltranspeptidase / glutathione hydrolase
MQIRWCRATRLVAALVALSLLAVPVSSASQEAAQADKAPAVESALGVVAADHHGASEVGAQMLAAGGNAADAGAAALLANGVLNPFASGLGGGGFCLYREAERGQVEVIDFRETAPLEATHDMYVVDGQPSRKLQMRGGLAVGVPGEPAGLWALQRRRGRLEWADVVDPAATLAKDGYPVGALLEKRLASRAEELEERPELAARFQIDGRWATEGDVLRRPGLARTLELYRDEGPIVFYDGEVGEAIVDGVNEAGGIFTGDDLRTYQIAHREPVVGSYRGYRVYSMPPPSSGGTTLIATLNILEGFELAELGRGATALHLITEALKHAFSDRARWLGDADFVDVPVERLTSPEYAESLRDKIERDSVLPLEEYGSHPQLDDDAGTSHLSVIDRDGNMLACTSTINTSFGSMVFVDEYGLIMNNEMGDFTAKPGVPNNYGLVGTEQNVVAPKKRPLSSMSPTLVMHQDEPFLAAGASGGPTIITATLMTMLDIIDFQMSPDEAVAAPRLHHQWRPEKMFIEEGIEPKEALRQRGHTLDVRPAFSSVQIVMRRPDGTLVGVSDPRKKGRPAAESPSAADRDQH